MISKDKITEIFCIADDFCKELEKVFKDIATKGKSTMGWYIGFKATPAMQRKR